MPDSYGAPPWEVRNLMAEVDTVQKKQSDFLELESFPE